MQHRQKDSRPSADRRRGRSGPAARQGHKPQPSATHAATRGPDRAPAPAQEAQGLWLYGRHAVLAALRNPQRRVLRLLATAETGQRLAKELAGTSAQALAALETVDRAEIARRLPGDAVHQGLAVLVAALPEIFVGDLIATAGENAILVVLDQLSDPHNVGAILRSAEAFGAIGVLTTDRHAPQQTSVLAKAASGALETVPLVRVTNLARALRDLKEDGFWIVGLSERGTETLSSMRRGGRIALVLGAEGEGLRQLTEQHCDLLLRLPMKGSMPSLNVSNAAAIALYELAREG